MDNINKSIASSMANSGSSAPAPSSSNCSLPMLEAAMKATKISPRSCLKPATRSPGRVGKAKPTKRASFVSDDSLLKCLVTGAHILPIAQTHERHEEFSARANEVAKQREEAEEARRLAREAGIEGSDSDSDSDDANNNYLLFTAREESRDDDGWDRDGVYAAMIERRLREADRARQNLDMTAIASGAVDFALYVTRSQSLVEFLEGLVLEYRLAVQVGSYNGDERRYSSAQGYAVTQLPAELYQNVYTAMSCIRRPPVTMTFPVVSRSWS
ncbi:uncharacterized protein BBA_07085 [Beauveria bassiana ARSEF 2860]|uniref:Uncharacterized protein n=1 Tax=Beauveria bassiana (strain ARSEF 2860) TaxID=655819 RepID=J4W0M6_BEAB2|nr:uncharacterized protein BBA_07085 [Beauveria bassiana ARSEF 2860]EJP64080.1 hypothetical protein BBA_07085 [Beauveria bassiana ARSEF 2860]